MVIRDSETKKPITWILMPGYNKQVPNDIQEGDAEFSIVYNSEGDGSQAGNTNRFKKQKEYLDFRKGQYNKLLEDQDIDKIRSKFLQLLAQNGIRYLPSEEEIIRHCKTW